MDKRKVVPIIIMTAVAFVIMFLFPAVVYKARWDCFGIGLVIVALHCIVFPVESILTGAYAGKDIKNRWFLPIVSTAFLMVAEWLEYKSRSLSDLILPYLLLYLCLGVVTMLVFSRVWRKVENTEKVHFRIAYFTIAVMALLFLFVPYKTGILDGGTVEYHAVTYDVVSYHRMIYDSHEYEGFTYEFPHGLRFFVGTKVSILGHVVYDDSHEDPAEPVTVPYEDSARDFIEYLTQNCYVSFGFHSVTIDQIEQPYNIEIMSCSFDESDTVAQGIIEYLQSTPDSFLNNAEKIYIYAGFSKLVIDVHTQTVTEMMVSDLRIMDLAESELILEDVQTVYVCGDDYVSEEEREVLERICPNACFERVSSEMWYLNREYTEEELERISAHR